MVRLCPRLFLLLSSKFLAFLPFDCVSKGAEGNRVTEFLTIHWENIIALSLSSKSVLTFAEKPTAECFNRLQKDLRIF